MDEQKKVACAVSSDNFMRVGGTGASGAMVGVTLGSLGGPVGVVIGAVVGGLIGAAVSAVNVHHDQKNK